MHGQSDTVVIILESYEDTAFRVSINRLCRGNKYTCHSPIIGHAFLQHRIKFDRNWRGIRTLCSYLLAAQNQTVTLDKRSLTWRA